MLTDRLADITTLYKRELRSALRERNIVLNTFVLPILLYPGLLWLAYSGVSFIAGQTESLTSRVVLAQLPLEHAAFEAFLDDQASVELLSLDTPEDALRSGGLDVLVEFSAVDPPPVGNLTHLIAESRIRLIYDGSRDRSRTARLRLEGYLADYREEYLLRRTRDVGISEAMIQQVWVEQENLATDNEMGRFSLSLIVPLLTVIMLVVGGVYPAIDSTAGERENSTWETLMTIAAQRSSIIIAKYMYVATMSFIAGMLNVIAITVSLRALLVPLIGADASALSVRLPFTTVVILVLGAALMALFVSAALMVMASVARTFREGQSMVAPFYIAILIPLLFLQVPDLQLTPQLAFVPIVNVTLMFRDAIEGNYQWSLFGITMTIEVMMIAFALALAHKIVSHENFLWGGSDGGLKRLLKIKFWQHPTK